LMVISGDETNQFQMQDNTGVNGNRETVYMILRVFNLETAGVGLKILVDPEKLRRRHELAFTAESWSVTTSD